MSTVTRRGQVTIPKEIRDRLGLAPGSRVEFALTADEQLNLLRSPASSSPTTERRYASIRGCANVPMTTDEIMASTRGG